MNNNDNKSKIQKRHINKNTKIKYHLKRKISYIIDNISTEFSNEATKIFITELQITSLMINILYNDILNVSNIDNFSTLPYIISNILSLNFIIPSEANEVYFIAILSICLALFTLYFFISFLNIITVVFSKIKYNQISKFKINWITFIMQYHTSIISFYFFVLPTNFIQTINTVDNEFIKQNAIWLQSPFILIIVANFFLCFFILHSATHVLFNDSMDGKRSNIDIWLILIFRLTILISRIIPNNDINTQKWCLISFIISFFMGRTWEILFYPCYYSMELTKIFGRFYGIKAGILSIGIIYSLIDGLSPDKKCLQLTCLIIMVCPVLSKFVIIFQEYLYKKNIQKEPGKGMKINHALSRFVYFSHVFADSISNKKKLMNNANLALKGKLICHLNECLNCTIKQDIVEFLNMPNEKNSDMLGKIKVHVLGKILKDMINIYPKAYKLSLLYIELIMNDDTKTFHQPFLLLQKIPLDKLVGYELLTYYLLKIRIQKKVKLTNENKFVNFESLLIAQKFEADLINKITLQVKTHLYWWKIFKEKRCIDIDDIMSLAIKIDDGYNVIKETWKNQKSTYHANLYIKPYLIYSIFLETIKDNGLSSEHILKNYAQLKTKLNYYDKVDKITQNNLSSEKNVVIKLTVAQNQLGDIIYCSNYIYQLLGYTKQEILTKNEIEIIMPQFYKALHKKFVSNYFNTGKSKVFNGTINIFTKHKEGYIIPSFLSVALIPDSIQGTSLIGLIRESNSIEDIILVSLDGHIVGFTKSIMRKWNIKPEDINNMIMIWSICPEFKKILSAYHLVFQNEIEINNVKVNQNLGNYPSYNEHGILKELEESSNLNMEKAEKLINKYSNEGEQLRYKLWKNKNSLIGMEFENYHTLIKKETYLNGICVLKLIVRKSVTKHKTLSRANCSEFQGSRANCSDFLTCFRPFNNKHIASLSEIKQMPDSIYHDEHAYAMDNMVSYGAVVNASKCLRDMKTHANININIINANDDSLVKDDHSGTKTQDPHTLMHLDNIDESKKVKLFSLGYFDELASRIMNSRGDIDEPKKPKNFSLANCDELTSKFINSKEGVDDSKNLKNVSDRNFDELSSKFLDSKDHQPEEEIIDTINKNELEKNSSYYSRASKIKRNFYKIHKALAVPYRPRILKSQLLLIPIMLIISVILMIMVEEKGKDVASEANNYVSVINTANQRSLNMIELYHRAKILWMIKLNLTDKRLTCLECKDYLNRSNHGYLQLIAQYLMGNTTIIAQSLFNFDNIMHEMFYDYQVKLYDVADSNNTTIIPKSGIIVDQFRAINIIYDQCVLLTKIPFSSVNENTTQLKFILENLIGDLGLALEDTNIKIANQMNSIIVTVKEFLYNIIVTLTPLCFLIWTTIIINIMHMYNENRHILLHIIKLSQRCFDPQIIKITNFMNQLNSEIYNLPAKRKKLSKKNTFVPNHAKEFKSISLKTISKKYLFRYAVKTFLLLAIILFIFLSFTIRYIYRGQLNQHRVNALDCITKATNQIYYQRLALIYLYDYVTNNVTGIVMNQPISTAFETAIQRISSQNEFINSFTFLDENNDPDIEFLLYGNACVLLPPNLVNNTIECVEIASGPSQRGLIGLNAFISQSIITSKNDFENSARQINDMVNSLNLECINDLEIISSYLTSYFYGYLYELLYEKFKIASENIIISGTIWIEISAIISLLAFLILWLPIYIILLSEIDNIKKVLKMLPKAHILSNITLKKFIMNTCGGMIHSLNN